MSLTIGSNLSTKVGNRGTNPVWLVQIDLPEATVYYTDWPVNISTTSPNPVTATWAKQVMQVEVQPGKPNATSQAVIKLSANEAALNYLALADLRHVTVTCYETQGNMTISTDDVVKRFEGVIREVRGNDGWAELICFARIQLRYAPAIFMNEATVGPHLIKPGVRQIGPKTFNLKRERF